MFAEELITKLAGIIALDVRQVEALDRHYQTLRRWNEKLNLTTIVGLTEAVERHYCESVFLAVKLPPGPIRIVDVGTGAGFPGYPVAVLRPDCSVTLLEAHHRKSVFLREVARGFGNLRVLCGRAEEVGESFDLVVSRGVSYEDLEFSLGRLAPRAVLLTGLEPPPARIGFSWDTPIPMPWGRQRFLRAGHSC